MMLNTISEHFDLWGSAHTTKSTSGCGSSNKLDLQGIKKLRELILELAVRGKLVPQNLEDEPASVLLERIAAEKAQLVKEKKIKKQRALSQIGEDEKFFDLPDGWEWTRLGSITYINPRNEAEDGSEASFVPMPLITTAYDGRHNQETRLWGEIKKGYTHFADGDIALAKITPCFENSKAAVFKNLKNGIGAGTTELHVCRPFGNTVNPFFILLYLKAPQFLLIGETKMTGTAGQKRVPKDFFAGNPLPLPPLAEQLRIVTKVNELMALCDQLEQQQTDSITAHQTLVEALLATLTNSTTADEVAQNWARIAEHFDTLFTTDHSIDQLKQTVLQLAVMGRLVPQNPDDEPASVLLEKIAAEKAQLVKEKKIKKQKPLPAIAEDEKPFALPDGWEWVRFGEIAYQITDGAHHTPKYTNQGVPFLSVKDMSSGKLNFSNTRFISEEQHEDLIKRCYPKKGDLLLTKVGTTGIPVLINTETQFSIFVSVALIKFPDYAVNGEYLSLLVQSPLVKHQSAAGTQGIGNKNLVLKTISGFRLLIPPFAEQGRIVAKANELIALCNILKSQIHQTQATQLHLANAIVEQAINPDTSTEIEKVA